MSNPDQLILDNLYFVHYIANKYRFRFLKVMSFDDMVGYGRLGLVLAAYKFDENRGIKFTSYASWWIYSKIRYGATKFGFVVHHRGYSTWHSVSSLNNPIGDEAGTEFVDLIEDDNSVMDDIDELIHSNEICDLCMEQMLPKEAEVFYHIYVLNRGGVETANIMRNTRQRVNQLKQRAENKARKVLSK